MVVVVGREGPIGFFIQEGDIFTGCHLHSGRATRQLVSEGIDGIFRIEREVVDKGSEEAIFLDCGSNRQRGIVGGDLLAIGGDDVEEIRHVFKDLIVRGTAIEGAGAKGMDGGGFASQRWRVGNDVFEGC